MVKTPIGVQGMKVDRKLFEQFKEKVENDETIKEQIERLRLKKMRMEDSARGDLDQKMDLLKLNIKEGIQVMSDVALNAIMKGESIKLKDDENNEYEPIFSIRFKKTSNKSFDDKENKTEKNRSRKAYAKHKKLL